MLQIIKTLIYIEVLLCVGLVFFRHALRQAGRRTVDGRAIFITLSIPVVGLLAGNIYIFYLFLAAMVALGGSSRAEVAATYVLMLPMMPLLTVDQGLGSIYLLPLSCLFAMNIGALIGFLTRPSKQAFTSSFCDAAIVLLILLFTLSVSRGESFTIVLRSLTASVVGFVGPYLLISRGVTSRDELDYTLLRWTLAGAMCAVVALFQQHRHWVMYQAFGSALHVEGNLATASAAVRGGQLRTGGPMVDYTAGGIFFAVTLMLLPYLKDRFRPGWFWCVVILMSSGLYVTQSRGAWVGAAVGFAFILAFRRRLWQAAALLGGAVLLRYVLFLSLSDDSKLAQIVGKSGHAAGTIDYRERLFSTGLQQVRAHLLFGQSGSQLIANMQEMVQGEHIVDFVNAHLYIAMAAGIPGFLIWSAIWLWPVAAAWRHRAAVGAPPSPAEIPVGIISASMTALIATSLIDRNLTWPTIALALAGPCFALAGTAAVRSDTRATPRARLVAARV